MKKVQTKTELIAIVNRLPEEKIPMAAEILESLAFYTEMHGDDEPVDEVEREAIRIGLLEESEGKTIPIEEIKKKHGL